MLYFIHQTAKKIGQLLSLFFLFLITLIAFTACTQKITIDLPKDAPQLVVEGKIENGVPPYVLLTKTTDIFGDLNINDYSSFFVHGANITVDNGHDTVHLVEYCLQNLPIDSASKRALLAQFGFSSKDSSIPNVCLYSTADAVNYFLGGTTSFAGKENTIYHLRIEAESKVLTASTRVPRSIPLDYIYYKTGTNKNNDTLVSLYAHLSVPDTFGNFIRYWTKRNSEPYYLPITKSVWDDKLFSGLSLSLPLERGQSAEQGIDANTFDYFWKGDTIAVKWANIDSKTYDFFNTLENDGGGNPFGSPIKIKSNVTGGLGVWAGYYANYYHLVVPK